jgi:hypothetical protein
MGKYFKLSQEDKNQKLASYQNKLKTGYIEVQALVRDGAELSDSMKEAIKNLIEDAKIASASQMTKAAAEFYQREEEFSFLKSVENVVELHKSELDQIVEAGNASIIKYHKKIVELVREGGIGAHKKTLLTFIEEAEFAVVNSEVAIAAKYIAIALNADLGIEINDLEKIVEQINTHLEGSVVKQAVIEINGRVVNVKSSQAELFNVAKECGNKTLENSVAELFLFQDNKQQIQSLECIISNRLYNSLEEEQFATKQMSDLEQLIGITLSNHPEWAEFC